MKNSRTFFPRNASMTNPREWYCVPTTCANSIWLLPNSLWARAPRASRLPFRVERRPCKLYQHEREWSGNCLPCIRCSVRANVYPKHAVPELCHDRLRFGSPAADSVRFALSTRKPRISDASHKRLRWTTTYAKKQDFASFAPSTSSAILTFSMGIYCS
jgi:hypothetical protein